MTAQLTYTVSTVKRETEDALQRSHRALDVQPGRHTAQRFADVAQSLSRAGVALAHAETCTAALQRVVELAYQVDTDSRRCNVDIDGRLLFALPWGKSGYKRWGLRRREADTLRAILLARQTPQQGRAVPLFVYDTGTRAWYVNTQDYVCHAEAQAYLSKCGITSREYKAHLERVQALGKA
jgi:hypothetical protein